MIGKNLREILVATAVSAISVMPAQDVSATHSPKTECEKHAQKWTLSLGALELKAIDEGRNPMYKFVLPGVDSNYARCMFEFIKQDIGKFYDVQYESLKFSNVLFYKFKHTT